MHYHFDYASLRFSNVHNQITYIYYVKVKVNTYMYMYINSFPGYIFSNI